MFQGPEIATSHGKRGGRQAAMSHHYYPFRATY